MEWMWLVSQCFGLSCVLSTRWTEACTPSTIRCMTSSKGLCLTCNLPLDFFVCLLFWVLPDMVLAFEMMMLTCGMLRNHEIPHRDTHSFRIVQGSWQLISHKAVILPLTSSSAAAAKSLQSCPTLCNPLDVSPPGSAILGILQTVQNTGVSCHFLLQCVKVKSESEVAQSCLTLSDPMDHSLPGSSVHGIFQARVLEC